MARTFVYTRVSTPEQTTDTQLGEIQAAGFTAVVPRRIVTETISGSVAALERPAFRSLLDRLEPEDVLVVTKLDRLGRNAMDVSATVAALSQMGIRVHCLALGGMDLTSAAGKMTMGVLNVVAEFERDLLVERTQAGLARARAEGKRLGRPPSLLEEERQAIAARLAQGESVSAIARKFATSRQTVMRVREAMADQRAR